MEILLSGFNPKEIAIVYDYNGPQISNNSKGSIYNFA